MRYISIILGSLLIIGCSDQEIQTYTAADGSGNKVVYNKSTQEVFEVAQVERPQKELDGKTLYGQRCASCHGLKGEKSAMNVSNVIAGYSADKTNALLAGYRDGSYGGTMKSIMQGQAKALSAPLQEKIVDYIVSLTK